MDGKVFNTISAPDSGEKEVNSMNDFIFDLQRFDDATTWKLEYDETEEKTVDDSKVTSAKTLKLTSGSGATYKEILLKPNSDKFVTIQAIDGLFTAGDKISVASDINLGELKLLVDTTATIEIASGKTLTGKTNAITIADGGDLTLSGKGTVKATNGGNGTVVIQDGAKLLLDGATIEANRNGEETWAGAVFVGEAEGDTNAKFEMKSGKLTAKTNDGSGVAPVDLYGQFVMSGGSIVADVSGTTSYTGWDDDKQTRGVYMNSGSTFNMEGGTIKASMPKYPDSGKGMIDFGVVIFGDSKFNMTGGEIYSYYDAAVSGNGTPSKGIMGPVINISGGSKITSENSAAIYHPQVDGKMTITADSTGTPEISGKNAAIEIRGGQVELNGGKYTATAESYTVSSNGNGSTTSGAAIAVAQHTTKVATKLTINGGTFTGLVPVSVSNPEKNDTTSPSPEVTINDGTFTATKAIETGTDTNKVDITSAINNIDDRVVVNVKKGTFNGALTNITYDSSKKTYTAGTKGSFVIDAASVTFGSAQTNGTAAVGETPATSGTIINIKAGATTGTGNKFADTDAVTDEVAYKTASGDWTTGSLSTALDSNTKATEIKLLKSFNFAGGHEIKSNLIIDLAGYTLTSSAATAFTVGTASTTLTIMDSASGGTLTQNNASAIATTPLIKVTNGTFDLQGGTLSNSGLAIDVTGGTAKLSGNNAAVNVTGGSSAINVGASGQLDVGSETQKEKGDLLRKINPTITFSSSSGGSSALAANAAISGVTDSTINIYGGDISTSGSSGYMSAVNAAGTLVIKGGTLNGAGGSAGYGLLYKGTATATIEGATITGKNYGVYNASSKTITISSTTTLAGSGAGYGAVSSLSTSSFQFTAGAVIDGVQTNKDSFYTLGTTANASTHAFSLEALKSTGGSNKAQTWTYTYGSATSNNILGSTSSVISFTGDLFLSDKVSGSTDPLDISVSGDKYTIIPVDHEIFNLAEGSVISLTGGITAANSTFALGTFDSAGAYNDHSKISVAGADDNTTLKFYGIGADANGFTIFDASDTGTDSMTFHTMRSYEFDFAGGDASINFLSTEGALDNLDTVIAISQAGTLKTVTINDASQLFSSVQSANGASISIATAGYQLTLASGAEIGYNPAATFGQRTESATADGATDTITYVYNGIGGIDSDGAAASGFRNSSTLGVVSYQESAKSFAFEGGDGAIAWASDAPTTAQAAQWFTLSTAADATGLTIDGSAFSTLQTDGAQLRFADGSASTYALTFENLTLVSGDNTYSSVAAVSSVKADGAYNYTYSGTGMSISAGFGLFDSNGASITAKNTADSLLTWHDKAAEISLSGSAVFSDSVVGSKPTVGSYLSLKDSVLTVLDIGAFASLGEGASLKVDTTGYKISLSSDATIAGASGASAPAFNILGEGDHVNAINNYSNVTGEFQGVGANEAGWSNSADTLFTYHEQYDTFTIDTANSNIALDNTTFAANVGFDKGSTAITIGAGAISTTGLADGQTLQLTKESAKKYTMVLGAGLQQVSVSPADWKQDAANLSLYEWKSNGAVNGNSIGADGYVLGQSTTVTSADSVAGNDVLTYRTAQKSAQFAVSEGDSMAFKDASIVAANISLDSANNVLYVNTGAFNAQTAENGAVVLSLTDADMNAGYDSLKLDPNTAEADKAKGTTQAVASFADREYKGRGASEKSGYADGEDGKSIVYYGLAKNFTFGGDLPLNSAGDSVSASDLLDVAPGSTKAVTIKGAAIGSDAEQGQTIFITSGDYALSVESGSLLSASNDYNTVRSLTADGYKDIGGTHAGFVAGTIASGSSAVNGYTYYQQQQNFTLGGDAGNSIGFATTPSDTLTYGTTWADSVLAAAITIKTREGTSGYKDITITNDKIFSNLENGKKLQLSTDSTKNMYVLNLNITDAPADLKESDINENPSLTGSNNSYTYTSAGANKTGFLTEKNAQSGQNETFTYYKASDTFNITTNGLQFSLPSVNNYDTNKGFKAGNGFTVDSAAAAVTIGSAAFAANSIASLASDNSIELGFLNNDGTTKYSLVLAADDPSLKMAGMADAFFTSIEGGVKATLSGMTFDNTRATIGSGATATTLDGFKSYKYHMTGATLAGFTQPEDNKSLLTYTPESNGVTLTGNLALVDDLDSNALTFSGNDVSIFLDTYIASTKRTGQFLTISNYINNSGEAYTLVQGTLAEANDFSTVAALTAGTGDYTYIYKSKGATTEGYNAVDGILTYYGKRDYTITFDGDAPLVTDNLTLESANATADSDYSASTLDVAIASNGTVVTISKNVINWASVQPGQTLSLSDDIDSKWTLQLANSGANSISIASGAYDVHSLTASSYHGIGADSVGFAAVKDSAGAATDTFKYYGLSSYLNLETAGSNIRFATVAADGDTVRAWKEEELAGAISVSSAKVNAQTTTTFTIFNTDIFDKSYLVNGATLQVDSLSSRGEDESALNATVVDRVLVFDDSTNWNLAESEVNSVESLELQGGNGYKFTFEGADKEGVLANGKNFIYYEQSKTFDITSDIKFNTDAVNSILSGTATNDLFNVGTVQSGSGSDTVMAYAVTIGAGAFDAEALAAAKGNEKISVGKIGDYDVKLVLNTSSAGSMNAYNATLAADPKHWTAGGEVTIGSGSDTSTAQLYTYREAGAKANTFDGNNSSVLTYVAQPNSVSFYVGKDTKFNQATIESSLSSAIAIDTEKKAITIAESALPTVQTAGSYLTLSDAFKTEGYTLNLSEFENANNTYSPNASFADNTYTSAGMSSVAGYGVTGSNTSDAKLVWADKSDVVNFDTSGGITFSSSNAAVLGAISIGADHKVSIGSAALSGTSWANNQTLKIVNSTVEGATQYTLVLGSGLSTATATASTASFNPTTGLFTGVGASGKAGYAVTGNNTLIYYATPAKVNFTGEFLTKGAFSDKAEGNINIVGSEISFNKAAFNFTKLTGDGTEKLSVQQSGYTINLESGDVPNVADSTNDTAKFDSTTKTYTGVGAKEAGFVASGSTATYWKAYDTFTLTTDSELNIADASAISVTTATSGTSTIKTVAFDPSAFGDLTSGQFIKLSDDSKKENYQFAATATESIKSDQVGLNASFSKSTATYTAAGASATGYLLTGTDQLTYYKKADSFKLTLTDTSTGATVAPANIPWSTAGEAAMALFFNVGEPDGTNKTVTISPQLLDLTKLKGDGTEVFAIESANMDGDKDQNTYIYNLGISTAWGEVTSVAEGSFTPNESGGGTLVSAGAVFKSPSSTQGFQTTDQGLVYYRKPTEVALTGTAVFKDIPADKLSACFTISSNTVTVKKAALDYITNLEEGTTLAVPSGYTLNIEGVAGAGSFNSAATFNTSTSGTNALTYTGKGLINSSAVTAAAGFQADGSSTTNIVYHDVADVISFSGSTTNMWAAAGTVATAITIDPVTTEDAGGKETTVKYVQVDPSAFKSLSNGNVLTLASTATSNGYKLDTRDYETSRKVGKLDWAGEYNSADQIKVTTTGEGDDAKKTYTYQKAGADNTGFVVETETSGDTTTETGKLTYRTKRADEFTFEVATEDGTPIAFVDAPPVNALSVPTSATSGVKTVTINPASLFADTKTQTDGATIKLVAADGYDYTYKASISSSSTSLATLTTKPSFSTSTYRYTFAGANKDGYTYNSDGVITYHAQAKSFQFNTGSGTAKFNSILADTNLDDWFKFTDKTVTADDGKTSTVKVIQIQPAAVSSSQTDGNTITLASSSTTGYEIDGSALIGENEYVATGSIAASDTGYTYTTKGATKENGFVNVTTGEGDVLTYHTKQNEIALTGTLKFNTEFADGKTIDDYITVSGTTLTIANGALASTQENGATITAAGYRIALLNEVTRAGSLNTASLTSTTDGNYTYKSAGANTPGYSLPSTATNNTLTYYTTPDTVNFIGNVPMATGSAFKSDSIKITTDPKDSTKKIVTVAASALTGTRSEGDTLMISDTSKYTLAVDDDLNGGDYYGTLAFTKDSTDETTGLTSYTYMFGGAKKNGFVNESGSDNYLTYHTMSSQINFEGDIGVVEGEATTIVENFTPNATDGTVTIDTAKAFTGGYDNTKFKITSSTGSIYTKLELVDSSDVAPEGEQDASLTKSDSGYTYESAGAKTPGYRLDTSDSATVVYRAAIDTVNFEGEIVLDETKSAAGAISVKDKVVTITNDAFGTQTANADLKISGTDYTLQFAEDDKHPVWAEKDAEFNEGKTVYTTKGYSETGYQLNEGTISYRIADRVEIPFAGLADTATTTNVAFDKETATFKLGNEALKDATNLVDGANVTVTGDYKLVLANADALKPVATEEDFDDMASGATTATYHNASNTGGYEVTEDAKTIEFTKKIESETLFTLSGVNNTVEKSIVTGADGAYTVSITKTNVADGATELSLAKGEGVTATATYTLKLTGEGMETEPTVETTNAFGTVDEKAHTVDYVATTKTSDYWLQDTTDTNKYTLTKTDDKEETLFTLSGVANTTDITVDDKKVVTAANANIAEGAETVAVTGDYTLNLTDVTTEGTTEHTYKFSEVADNKATYVDTATTNAFWTKAEDSKSYAFTAEKIEDTNLFELSGVANTTDIAVSEEKVVTAANANIAEGAETVAVTGDYTLNLTDVTTEGTTEHTYKFSEVADNKATYVDTATTNAFWTKAEDSKSYAFTAEKIEDTNLFELSGVANTTDITVDDKKVVTAANANIAEGAETVAVTGDYTLSLTDVETEGTTEHTYKFSEVADNKATYVDTATTNAFWTKADDSKSYALTAEKVEDTNLFELSGVANTTDVAVTEIKEDETVTGHKVVLTSANVATDAKEISLTGTNNVLELSGDDLPTAPVYGDTTKDFGDVDETTHTVKYIATTAGENYWKVDDTDTNKYTLTKTDDKKEDIFTLTGVKSKDGITVGEDGTVTITSASLIDQDTPVTLDGDGYKLAMGDGITPVEDVSASYADSVYSAKGKSAGYSVSSDGKTLSYSDTTVKSFTFENVAEDADDSSFYYTSGDTITVGQSAVKTDGTAITFKEASDGGSYNLKLGRGMSAPTDVAAAYADNIYTTEGKSAGYNLSEDAQSISYSDSDTISFTFEGVADGAEASNFYLKDNVMTIGLAAVNTDGTTLTLKEASDGGEYTLKRGKGMTASTVYEDATYTASSMTYNTKGATAGYILSDDAKSITYNAEDTTTAFKFSGVADGAEAANFYLKDNVMTIGLAAVKTDGTAITLESVSDDGEYTLKRGKGMDAGYTYDAATYNASKMTYNTAGTVAGYVLSDDAKSISYNADTTSTTFQFKGVADGAETSNFYLKDNVMTIGLAAVNTDGTALTLTNVSDGGEYTLKRGKGMTAGYTYDTATYNASNMTYNTAGTVAGYVLSDDAKSLSYNAETTATTFKFSGVADDAQTSNFYLKGNVMTIGQAAVKTDGTALTLKSVSDEGDYTLKLGKGMTAATVYDAATYTASSMTYNTKGATAGYALSSDAQSIAYNETATTTTFQFSGVADGAETSNFYLKDNVMTIGLAAVKTDGTALTLTNVSDGGEYTLKRGKGMTAAYTYDTATYDASKMTYNTAGTTAGYVLSDDAKSLSYNETATSDTFKFTGIADDVDESAFYVNAKNKTMTIGKAAVKLDGTAVKLTSAPDDEYVLKLGKGMSEATTETQTALDSGTFSVNEVTEGYALSEDKKSIAYDSTSETALEITGVASEPTISDKQVAVTTATFDDTTITVTNNTSEYTFSVASGDYSGKTFTGSATADTVTSQGDYLSINTGAGNDYIRNSGLNVSINGGNGDDSILGGAGDEYFTGFNGNDYLHGGAGADTLNGGGGDDTLFGAAGDDSLNGGAGNDSMLGGNGNDQLLGGAGDDYLSGGAGNDVLRAGAGTDTLWGGAGNDKLYGGDGVDTFIYRPNEGTDSIYNYTSGEDLLQIVDADGNDVNFTKSTFNSSKGTLALDIDGGGKVYFGGVTASDTFDINGKTYEISGSKLVEK